MFNYSLCTRLFEYLSHNLPYSKILEDLAPVGFEVQNWWINAESGEASVDKLARDIFPAHDFFGTSGEEHRLVADNGCECVELQRCGVFCTVDASVPVLFFPKIRIRCNRPGIKLKRIHRWELRKQLVS